MTTPPISAGIDVSQLSGRVLCTTRSALPGPVVTTGKPATAHAVIPPDRLTASNPHARSASATAAERPPERHKTTIGRS